MKIYDHDTAPELHYTFIEQALHPGPALALQCAAAGSPAPRFTWLLDDTPVDEHNTAHRTITQFMSPHGDVVSFLNLTSVRPEDGGRYTCRAANSRGSAQHSTRLNVYGPPSIRSAGPLRVVAGANTTVHCPYSGFPISEIRWQRNGVDVPPADGPRAGGAGGAAAGAGGELLLWPAEAADAGVYSCRVTAPGGQYAQKDLQVFVRNPPKISGFSFPTDLVEGSSVQVLCGITSGDKPVYFSWLKDGQHIPSSLQVQEKSLDEFSFLIFSHVTSKHSGEYTCVATNSAAEVNHTARLAVHVAPAWLVEPRDVAGLLGTSIVAHCAASGYPEPRVQWLKGHGTTVVDFRPVSNLELQVSVLHNGSLVISPASHLHEGQYQCRAENGRGRPLTKTIRVSVNEPAHFEYSSRNMSVKRTTAATLQCAARGDAPLHLQWTHNMKRIDFTTYRVSVSEKRSEGGASSQLSIAHAERHDSGVYRCRAENAYGRDELLIYLAVQEFPDAPRGLHVLTRGARGATLAWARGYDGNARVRTYRLQYRVVGERQTTERDDWTDAPTREVPADRVVERHELSDSLEASTLEYLVEGLRPATAYAMRLAAVNSIGESEYSDAVIVKTMEEAPSEPPHNVQVQATAPGELLVKWQSPPQDSWNGELLGYVVTWGADVGGGNGSQSLTVAGWGAREALLPAAHAVYRVTVQAFNAVGAGPACAPVTVTALEGVPEAAPARVRCEALSAQSLRVWWEPPPPPAPPAVRGGLLLGYEVLYELVDSIDAHSESRRSGGSDAVLTSLRRAGNYSVRVRARSGAGPGPPSEPVYCSTHEDVPGPPADIKALANSEDTVIVSWLPPTQKNGKIKHYTVYSRPQRTGAHSQQIVLHKDDSAEYWAEVRGLREHQLYDFWVTAATASGEGDMSAVVARKPNARAPAKITSFGRRTVAAAGAPVRLRCGAAGAPPPVRSWGRRRPAPPLLADPRFVVEGVDLVILKLDRSLSDNYSCVVRNSWGEERAWWEVLALLRPGPVRARVAPAAATRLLVEWEAPYDGGAAILGKWWEVLALRRPGPVRARAAPAAGTRLLVEWEAPYDGGAAILGKGADFVGWLGLCVTDKWWEVLALLRPGPVRARVAPAAATRLSVEWEAPYDGGAAILGYTVQYAREGHSHWSAAAAAGDARSLTLQRLACGARYRLRVTASNAVGDGELGEELVASTKGGPSKAAPEKDLISTNNTCVRLNLLTWESNGCPVSSFQVSLRGFEESAWRSLTVPALTQPVTVCELAPGTWFHLKVVATSTAGTTVGAYYFATLTDAGG
ncbi:hypothetical protein JYU34_003034 [Plutella xylostella]|uniref:Down syndrome cell adhesion molecule-like protein Dscam2 n=1 Tax=Plutella xylostella TaxID=51655 RepID=A0ABQ7QZ04_PLUXY|nr:hypothetical protein JYU34_003034 [Plutella xylostella]